MVSHAEIHFLIEQLQRVSGFNLDYSLKGGHQDLKKSLKIFKEIVTKVPSEFLDQKPNLEILTKISCYLLQNVLFQQESQWVHKESKSICRIDSYLTKLFTTITNTRRSFVVELIITYLNDTNLWQLQYISGRLFKILLLCDFDSELILAAFVSYVEKLLSSKAFQVGTDALIVLHEILTLEAKWENINSADVTHILRLYHTICFDDNGSDISSGFELCLQDLFRVISGQDLLKILIVMIPLALDTSVEVSLPFGNLTLKVVNCYLEKGKFSDIPTFLLEYLIEAIKSIEPSISFFACKVLARFFDTNCNYNEFLFPKIFHSHMGYNLNPSATTTEELSLILTYQKSIYDALFQGVKQHNDRKKNLNAIYLTLCTIIVKILPGAEAASVVCLIMDIQTFFLESRILQKNKNYGHGLVLSLMSLFCWIYRGKPLVTYVEKMISKRFSEALYLLPPSSVPQSEGTSYKSPINLKKTLFFDNLELRYALWKCFVTKETIVEVSQSTKRLSKTTKNANDSKDFQLKLNLTSIE